MLSFAAARKSETAGMEEYKCFDVALDNSWEVNRNIVRTPVVISAGHACSCSKEVAADCPDGFV